MCTCLPPIIRRAGQVAIEREARREAKRDLKDMLAAKEIAPYLPYRSRMTNGGTQQVKCGGRKWVGGEHVWAQG